MVDRSCCRPVSRVENSTRGSSSLGFFLVADSSVWSASWLLRKLYWCYCCTHARLVIEEFSLSLTLSLMICCCCFLYSLFFSSSLLWFSHLQTMNFCGRLVVARLKRGKRSWRRRRSTRGEEGERMLWKTLRCNGKRWDCSRDTNATAHQRHNSFFELGERVGRTKRDQLVN